MAFFSTCGDSAPLECPSEHPPWPLSRSFSQPPSTAVPSEHPIHASVATVGTDLNLASPSLLSALPLELKHFLFSFLPFDALGQLALVSREWNAIMLQWIQMRAALKRADRPPELPSAERLPAALPPNPLGGETWARRAAAVDLMRDLMRQKHSQAAELIVMAKRATCLMSTRARFEIAGALLDRILAGQAARAGSSWSEPWGRVLRNVQWSGLMHVFMRGWDPSEFPAVFQLVEKKFNLRIKVREVLQSESRTDVCVAKEMKLRLLLRSFTWDFAGPDYSNRATWIVELFRRIVGPSPKDQAITFFLIFGPPCQNPAEHGVDLDGESSVAQAVLSELYNHADWDITNEITPLDFHEGKSMFYLTAQAVCSCTISIRDWSEHMMERVIDALVKEPEDWKRENVAGFLLFCSEQLIVDYLKRKLSHEKSSQTVNLVARLLVDMVIMSHRFENELYTNRGIGKIFLEICAFPEPKTLRPLLHTNIWRLLTSELELTSLEVEHGEISSIFEKLWQFIMANAFAADPHRNEEPKSVSEQEPNVSFDTDVEGFNDDDEDMED